MKVKSRKTALILSSLSLLLCFAMLIGSTFAWFTDTASTGVSTITSGRLDVEIVAENGVDKITELNWVKAGGHETEEVLWEPGCTYTLTPFKIANVGNLALKYKLVVTGLDGDAELLKVIKFTAKKGSADADLEDLDGVLLPDGKTDAKTGEEVGQTDVITISAHMDESAGNEYMSKTLSGISITVYATQYTYENDSEGNTYDKDATYYPVIDAAGLKDALATGGNIDVKNDLNTVQTMVAKKDTTINMNGKIIANENDIWDDANWSLISAQEGAELTITGNGTFQAKEDDCYAVDVQGGATVTIEDGTFVGNIHAVYVLEGTAHIKGGFFSVQQKYPDAAKANEFVLNCYDANRAAGTAKIIVTGGTFVNFNPADCYAEGAHTNFVADGYSVISEQHGEDTWFTVVKGTGVAPSTQEELNSAITNSSEKTVTVVMPENSSFTLDSGIANGKSRDITFVGDGTQTVDVVEEAVNAEGGMLNYQRGSTFTFENLTIQAGQGSFDGIVCDELVYKNCTIKGKLTLYGKATFIDCTFDNTMANQYSIWTWGGTDVTFENCIFNTNGKAILLYGQATAEKPTNLTVTGCTFNDRNSGAAGKAAIEIGNDYNATYNLIINNITVNGFAEGKNTDSKLWANKKSMDAEHLSVTIDGAKIQ